MTDDGYTPIACGLHDQLQLLVLRGRSVRVVARDAAGAPLTLEGRVVDVFTRDGAEWLTLDDGTSVRLDRLVDVDGIPFTSAC